MITLKALLYSETLYYNAKFCNLKFHQYGEHCPKSKLKFLLKLHQITCPVPLGTLSPYLETLIAFPRNSVLKIGCQQNLLNFDHNAFMI